MVDAFRAQLDELMGKHRDAPLHERSGKKTNFSDPEVCKYELVAVCPNQLFKNTRSDLGACPAQPPSCSPCSHLCISVAVATQPAVHEAVTPALNAMSGVLPGSRPTWRCAPSTQLSISSFAGACGFSIHADHLDWAEVKEDWDKLDEREKER